MSDDNPKRVPGTSGQADHIRQLDAQCKAKGLTDHDRHEVLRFASRLHERAREEQDR
jgi:hypothetical protein